MIAVSACSPSRRANSPSCGREHRFLAGDDVGVTGKREQRVGVDDERSRRLRDEAAHDLLRHLLATQAGSDDDRTRVARHVEQRVDDRPRISVGHGDDDLLDQVMADRRRRSCGHATVT